MLMRLFFTRTGLSQGFLERKGNESIGDGQRGMRNMSLGFVNQCPRWAKKNNSEGTACDLSLINFDSSVLDRSKRRAWVLQCLSDSWHYFTFTRFEPDRLRPKMVFVYVMVR